VLDTDVLVAALRNPQGASAALLRSIGRGLDTLFLSVSLALEHEAICQLPEHRLAAGLSMKDVNTFLIR
jgi:predicted nucleic acid-binding protein